MRPQAIASRRTFLKTTALAASAASLCTARSWGQVIGANETIRVGVIGFKGRGTAHIDGFSKIDGVRVAALCDCDEAVLAAGVKRLKDKGPVATYADLRKLIESKDIDAISSATPNHWHSLITVWGCQAGKDVYIEKPVSHNVWEGRQSVAAARKYNRIVQTGTQSRSVRAGLADAIAWVQAGNLGKIQLVRALCYKRRDTIGKADGVQPIPPGIDYDLWCGPAPKEELRRLKLHYDWHWIWNYGNGDLGNQGIHQMDIARWFLGEQELSPRVWSLGGRFGYVDDGQTANTQMVFHDYAKAPLLFEVRGLPEKTGSKKMDEIKQASIGVIAHCESGDVVVGGAAASGAVAYDKGGKEIQRWKGSEDHFANFIKAVRSRRKEDLNADIAEGHLSSALCHTGNISYRLGHTMNPDEIKSAIKADRDATATFERMAAHLAANGVDLTATPATLGPVLKMDPKTERFIDNDAANAMLSRKYREPFVVPQIA